MRTEQIGDCTLILGDSRDVLSGQSGWDLLLTDPPYGISYASSPVVGKNRASEKFTRKNWDLSPPTQDHLDILRYKATEQIIWGGNYFVLPPSRSWLVWFKPDIAPSMGQCELAWTNLNQTAKVITHSISATGQERVRSGNGHPTQKPLPLILWCLEMAPTSRTVLDPYMGSGTTGVACAKRGLTFTGVEIDPEYFDLSCRRVEDAYRQPDMLVQAPAPMEQTALALE